MILSSVERAYNNADQVIPRLGGEIGLARMRGYFHGHGARVMEDSQREVRSKLTSELQYES